MPIAAIHPGEHLAEELDISAAELARNIGVPTDLRLARKKAGKSVKAFPGLKRSELVHA